MKEYDDIRKEINLHLGSKYEGLGIFFPLAIGSIAFCSKIFGFNADVKNIDINTVKISFSILICILTYFFIILVCMSSDEVNRILSIQKKGTYIQVFFEMFGENEWENSLNVYGEICSNNKKKLKSFFRDFIDKSYSGIIMLNPIATIIFSSLIISYFCNIFSITIKDILFIFIFNIIPIILFVFIYFTNLIKWYNMGDERKKILIRWLLVYFKKREVQSSEIIMLVKKIEEILSEKINSIDFDKIEKKITIKYIKYTKNTYFESKINIYFMNSQIYYVNNDGKNKNKGRLHTIKMHFFKHYFELAIFSYIISFVIAVFFILEPVNCNSDMEQTYTEIKNNIDRLSSSITRDTKISKANKKVVQQATLGLKKEISKEKPNKNNINKTILTIKTIEKIDTETSKVLDILVENIQNVDK